LTVLFYTNPLIKYIVMLFFSMEGRGYMWDPWYLMILDKPYKVECKFYNAIISYCRDRIYSIWVIDMMIVGEMALQCVQKYEHK